MTTCERCDGERLVASSDEGEPWSAWDDLPPGSDLAVRMGMVYPIACPDCAAEIDGLDPHPPSWIPAPPRIRSWLLERGVIDFRTLPDDAPAAVRSWSALNLARREAWAAYRPQRPIELDPGSDSVWAWGRRVDLGRVPDFAEAALPSGVRVSFPVRRALSDALRLGDREKAGRAALGIDGWLRETEAATLKLHRALEPEEPA